MRLSSRPLAGCNSLINRFSDSEFASELRILLCCTNRDTFSTMRDACEVPSTITNFEIAKPRVLVRRVVGFDHCCLFDVEARDRLPLSTSAAADRDSFGRCEEGQLALLTALPYCGVTSVTCCESLLLTLT